MIETIKQLFANQYSASLCTLGSCLDQCPEDCWDLKIGNGPFQWVAFHTLFFTDYYLGKNPESFQSQPFHENNRQHFGNYVELENRTPVTQFSREFIDAYLQHCRQKAETTLQHESDDMLTAPCGFPRKAFSRAELHAYNIRHIQHHAAHLSLRLRRERDIDIPWVGSGWHVNQ